MKLCANMDGVLIAAIALVILSSLLASLFSGLFSGRFTQLAVSAC